MDLLLGDGGPGLGVRGGQVTIDRQYSILIQLDTGQVPRGYPRDDGPPPPLPLLLVLALPRAPGHGRGLHLLPGVHVNIYVRITSTQYLH